jgi:hypothetical protein
VLLSITRAGRYTNERCIPSRISSRTDTHRHTCTTRFHATNKIDCLHVYTRTRSFKLVTRTGHYVEIVIPVEERLEFNIYQAHRGEETWRAEGYYASSATPWRNRVAFDESTQSLIRINFETSSILI